MNNRKLLAITIATAITFAGFAGVRAWSDAAVARIAPPPARVGIVVLPTITVRPTAKELEAARRGNEKAMTGAPGGAGIGLAAFDMPYYSFGVQPAASRQK